MPGPTTPVAGASRAGSEPSRAAGRPRDPLLDDRILDACLAELQRVGYHAMTLDVVARAAGVSKPTLYRRWRSKPDVTVAALIRHYGAEPVTDNGSLREDLLVAQRHTAALLGDPATVHILSALLADLSRHPELNRTWKDGFLAPRRRSFQAALDRARARGEWPHDISSNWAADWLTGPLLSHVLLSREPLEKEEVDSTVDRFLRAFPPGG